MSRFSWFISVNQPLFYSGALSRYGDAQYNSHKTNNVNMVEYRIASNKRSELIQGFTVNYENCC